jgi:hypothetical protein
MSRIMTQVTVNMTVEVDESVLAECKGRNVDVESEVPDIIAHTITEAMKHPYMLEELEDGLKPYGITVKTTAVIRGARGGSL